MIVTLVTLLSIVSFAAGEPRAICPNETIKAVEGERDVTLPCHLDPPVNVVNYAMDWKRVDLNNKVVYSYRDKKDHRHPQMDQYRDRTTLNHEDLSRGVLSLHISSVKLSDSGQYRCFVSKLMTSCNTSLVVVTKDQHNETKGDDSSTTGPPEEKVTEPDDHDAAKKKAAIVGGVVGVAVVAAAVVLILVKRGTIQICMRGKEAETTQNHFEMENLRNQAAEEDEDHAAENGTTNTIHASPA